MAHPHREHALINVGVTTLEEACATLGLTGGVGLSGGSVTSLVLHGNRIGSLSSPPSLRLPSLRALNLSSNEVGYGDCGDLSYFCPGLEHLDLAANRVSGVRGLSTLHSLTALNLAFNALVDLRWLKELGGGEGGGGGEVLHPPTLTRLDLRDNAISDPGELFALRHLPALRELRLRAATLDRQEDGTIRVHSANPNPVCLCPTYLPIILAACPALVTLDGIPVSVWRESLQGVQAHVALLAAASTPYAPPGVIPPPPHSHTHFSQLARITAASVQEEHQLPSSEGAAAAAPNNLSLGGQLAASMPKVELAGRRFLARFLKGGGAVDATAAGVAGEVGEALEAARGALTGVHHHASPRAAALAGHEERLLNLEARLNALADGEGQEEGEEGKSASLNASFTSLASSSASAGGAGGAIPPPPLLQKLLRARGGKQQHPASKPPSSSSSEGEKGGSSAHPHPTVTIPQEALHTIEKERDSAIAKCGEFEAALQESRTGEFKKEGEVASLKAALAGMEDTLHSLRGDLSAARGESSSLRSHLESQRVSSLEALEKAEGANATLRSRLAAALAAGAGAPSALEYEALERKLGEVSESLRRCECEREEERGSVGRLSGRLGEVSGELERLRGEREVEREREREREAALATAQAAMEKERERRSRGEEAHTLSTEQLLHTATDALMRAKAAESAAAASAAAAEEAAGREATAHGAVAALRAECAGVRAALAASEESRRREVEEERGRGVSAVAAAESRVAAIRSAAEEEVRLAIASANARLEKAREAVEAAAGRAREAGKAGEVAREERDRVERRCASLSSALADAEGKCAALKEEVAEGAKERAGALAAFESREAARVAEWSTRVEGAEGEARVSREEAARAKASAAAALTEVRIKDAQLSDAMESNRRLKRELEGEKEERAAEVGGVREGAAELRARLEEVCERVDAAIAAREEAVGEAGRATSAAISARRVAEQLAGQNAMLKEQVSECEGVRSALAAKEAALAFVEKEVGALKGAYDARLAAACADRDAAQRAAGEAGAARLSLASELASVRAECASTRGECDRLARALEASQSECTMALSRVSTVESEMRVLLGELDAGRARQAEVVRRMAGWVATVAAESGVGGGGGGMGMGMVGGGGDDSIFGGGGGGGRGDTSFSSIQFPQQLQQQQQSQQQQQQYQSGGGGARNPSFSLSSQPSRGGNTLGRGRQ